MVDWSAQSTSTTPSLPSSPLQICQNQCLQLKHPPPPSSGYLPAVLARRPPKPRAPPVDHSVAPAPPAIPAEYNMPPPTAASANQRPEPAPPRRRSPRLNPEQGQAHAISNPPANRFKMGCTYPLTIKYNDCLGRKANPLSFASLRLVDHRNGHSQYLSTMGQLMDALPKTLDPAFRFTLRGHVACPGQACLPHSMRAVIWFLLPSDGVFRHSSSSLQYYLARQVMRRGDVTRPPLERRLNWVPDLAPTPPRDHGKENHPPAAEPRKLPRKIRPRRKWKEHHHHPGTSGSEPNRTKLGG